VPHYKRAFNEAHIPSASVQRVRADDFRHAPDEAQRKQAQTQADKAFSAIRLAAGLHYGVVKIGK
jgi:hypothetical protein